MRADRRRDALFGGLVIAALAAGSVAVIATASPSKHTGSSSGTTATTISQSPSTTSPASARLASEVSMSPAPGSNGVPLDAVITLTAGKGQFTSVAVTPPKPGAGIPGTYNQAATVWTSDAVLQPSTTYQIKAALSGVVGVTATVVSSLTTLTPSALVGVTLSPAQGQGVGVGQPIILTFNQAVTSTTGQNAVLSHLKVALNKPVAVGAHWFSPTVLHLRPETYWPSGERVTLSYDLAGWDAGSGLWGQGSGAVRVTIGSARVSTLDLTTHALSVTLNGSNIGTLTIYNTPPLINGTHIVLGREATEPGAYWVVNIASSPEYVCSLAKTGVSSSVTNACVDLKLGPAEQYYYLSRPGDVVNVTGGSTAASTTDQGTMDWTTPWSAWTPLAINTSP
jgi:hypothetical protein